MAQELDEEVLAHERTIISDFEMLADVAEDSLVANTSQCRREIETLRAWLKHLPVIRHNDVESGRRMYMLGIWGATRNEDGVGTVDERGHEIERQGTAEVMIQYSTMERRHRGRKVYEGSGLEYPYFGSKDVKESVHVEFTVNYASETIQRTFRYLSALMSTTTKTSFLIPLPDENTWLKDYRVSKSLHGDLLNFFDEYRNWIGCEFRMRRWGVECYPTSEVDRLTNSLLARFERIVAPFEQIQPQQLMAEGTKASWRKVSRGEEAGGAFGAPPIPQEILPGAIQYPGQITYIQPTQQTPDHDERGEGE